MNQTEDLLVFLPRLAQRVLSSAQHASDNFAREAHVQLGTCEHWTNVVLCSSYLFFSGGAEVQLGRHWASSAREICRGHFLRSLESSDVHTWEPSDSREDFDRKSRFQLTFKYFHF